MHWEELRACFWISERIGQLTKNLYGEMDKIHHRKTKQNRVIISPRISSLRLGCWSRPRKLGSLARSGANFGTGSIAMASKLRSNMQPFLTKRRHFQLGAGELHPDILSHSPYQPLTMLIRAEYPRIHMSIPTFFPAR